MERYARKGLRVSGLVGHRGLLLAATGATPPDPAFGWRVQSSAGGAVAFSEGNAVATWTSGGSGVVNHARTDVAISGKTYVEMRLVSKALNGYYQAFGIIKSPYAGSPWSGANMVSLICRQPMGVGACGLPLGQLNVNGVTAAVAYGAAPGDIVGIAYDAATRKLWLSLNGSWVDGGDPAAGAGELGIAAAGTYFFFSGGYTCTSADANPVFRIYAAAANQSYPPPIGFSPYQP